MGEKKGKALAMELFEDLLGNRPEHAPPSLAPTPTSPTLSSNQPQGDMDDTVEVTLKVASPATESTERSASRAVTLGASTTEKRSASTTMQVPNRPVLGDSPLWRADNLKVAQSRIIELEREIDRLRTENEQLAAAGQTLSKSLDEVQAQKLEGRAHLEHVQETSAQQVQLFKSALAQKERESQVATLKIHELEARLSSNLQRIRVRERELENRLELMKVESAALLRSKDEMILELKRQIDQLNFDMENYRQKTQELNQNLIDRQDALRRTVKALRLALSMLEGSDPSNSDGEGVG